MRLQLGRPLSESLPRVHSSSLSVGLRWSPSPHGTCPAAAPVLRQARLASYRTARTCKKPATARRHRSCRASAASPVSASEAPAEATAAAEPASSTNPGTTSLDDIPPAEAEQAASSEPSGSESPEHDLPFNVGDNVVGCVVRNSRLGAHVRLSTHNGLLGWVSNSLKPRQLRNSYEETPFDPSGTTSLPLGLRREWRVMEVRPGAKAGQWYPRLSAVHVDNDVMRERCKQLIDLHEREPANLRVTISGCNSGGLTLLWEGISGFIPFSAVLKSKAEILSREELQARYVRQELEVVMTELKVERMTSVMSQRQADYHRVMRKVREGTVHWATVDSVIPKFAAWVNLDDPHAKIRAMVHISALSQAHTETVDELLKPGDRVCGIITGLERPTLSRINLSVNILEDYPGQMYDDPEAVYKNAPAVCKRWQERMREVQRRQRELAATGSIPLGKGNDEFYRGDDSRHSSDREGEPRGFSRSQQPSQADSRSSFPQRGGAYPQRNSAHSERNSAPQRSPSYPPPGQGPSSGRDDFWDPV